MFPYGNFGVEMSKFSKNVTAWELLVALAWVNSRTGTLLPKARLFEPNARGNTDGPHSAWQPNFKSTFEIKSQIPASKQNGASTAGGGCRPRAMHIQFRTRCQQRLNYNLNVKVT
jgi:hypothetical protein